mmetsp:Transcript_27049/g.76085  ORF Transcript_27049/g.76085 Transcript_27049/m.76085 type:complete len:278 (+) Transcript_27049:752-1585(+)
MPARSLPIPCWWDGVRISTRWSSCTRTLLPKADRPWSPWRARRAPANRRLCTMRPCPTPTSSPTPSSCRRCTSQREHPPSPTRRWWMPFSFSLGRFGSSRRHRPPRQHRHQHQRQPVATAARLPTPRLLRLEPRPVLPTIATAAAAGTSAASTRLLKASNSSPTRCEISCSNHPSSKTCLSSKRSCRNFGIWRTSIRKESTKSMRPSTPLSPTAKWKRRFRTSIIDYRKNTTSSRITFVSRRLVVTLPPNRMAQTRTPTRQRTSPPQIQMRPALLFR